jgi:hypothetical protein|nr:MAG TPA: DEXDc-like helicases superfamily [Caudoviricetes sp.]
MDIEMAEIEVGEYGRTNFGKMIKFAWLESLEGKRYENKVLLINEDMLNNDFYYFHKGEKIVKHSKQLIDLIEVGDYVNGREVKHIAMFEGFPDYPKLIFVDETHLIPDDTCENDEIQTILTKEIYMANCYKVGGEYE